MSGDRSREQLIEENRRLRARVADLENRARNNRPSDDLLNEYLGQYRAMIDAVNEGIIIVQDNRFVFANCKLSELLGTTVEKLVGSPVFAFVWPEDRPTVEANSRRRLAGQHVPESYEFRAIGADGGPRWVRLTVSMIRWNGQPATLNLVMDIHRQKQDEEAVRQSELKFRALAESTSTGIFMIQGTRYIYVNPAFEAIVGYSLADLEDTDFWDFVHPDHRDLVRDRGLNRLRGEHPEARYEFKVVARDGREKWVDFTATAILMDGVQTLVGSAVDITERKRIALQKEAAREALIKSESLLRAITGSAQDAIVMTDPVGRISFWNPAAEKIFGYTGAEAMGRSLHPLLAPPRYLADCKAAFDAFRRTGHGGTVGRTIELEARRSDGEEIPVELSLSAVRLEDGWHALAIVRDITTRKLAEQSLRKSEEKYRNLTDNIPDIVYSLDATGNILAVNEKAISRYGYDAKAVTGRPFLALIHPDDRGLVVTSFLKAIEDRREYTRGLQFRVLSRGAVVWVELNSHMRFDESGGFLQEEGVLRDITLRKQAEEALREGEERYRLFVEKSFAGVYVVQDGVSVFMNDTSAAIAGYRPEELIGRQSSSLIYAEDRERVNERTRRMLRGGELSPYEFRVVAKNGQIRWVMETVTSIRYGGKRAILGNSMDITAHKRVDAEREKAEYLYRTLARHAQSAVFIVQDGRFRFVNPYASFYTGYDESELLGMDPVFLIHPEDREQARRDAIRMIKGDLTSPYEFRIVRKDGGIRWIIEANTPVELDGRPAVLMNSMDMTERKQAEERSRQSEEKFSTVFMMAPDCVAITRLEDGLLMDVNLGFEEITGWTRTEAIGRNSLDIHFWVDEAERDYMAAELTAGRDILHREFLFRRKDRSVRSGIYSARSLILAGEPCLIFILQDVTDRKHFEEERQRLEQRLFQSQKMEAIGTLAGGIAHDFNNLLMGIQGHASLMMMDLSPSHPHADRLRQIEEQVKSGTGLTRQILGLARGGRYEVKPSDMNEIVRTTSSMFGRTRKEITIHRRLAEGLWSVEVDRVQMEQVLMNLYVNAWQAMPDGGTIFLETRNAVLGEEKTVLHSLKPGKYVRIVVIDTGAGIDEKTRERIFDPFFTTKPMGRGTGLGLATVYGIVKGHGGFIEVDSTPGEGTTFVIHLPAADKEIVIETDERQPVARGSETILIVDDEDMVLEVTKELLESLGYRTCAVRSGQEAIDLYREKTGQIDLVILDMIMPGMSGGEAFDRLREIDPGVKTLLSSGYSIDGQAQSIMDRGCSGFLQKPFHLEQLSSKIREVLAAGG